METVCCSRMLQQNSLPPVKEMERNTPAFCTSPVSLQRRYKKRHRFTWACAQTPLNSEGPTISRRVMLFGLAGFLVSPSVAAAEKTENTPKPITGFLSRSGLKYFDFERGEGPTPKWGDLVNIHYTAYTISPDSKSLIKQDSSHDYGDDGYLIHHGNGEQILGLEEAIHSMGVGGRRRCIIPRNIAYFKTGLGPVPLRDRRRRAFSEALTEGDGTVVLDIELRWIVDDPFYHKYYDDLVPTDEEIMQTFAEQQGQYADD